MKLIVENTWTDQKPLIRLYLVEATALISFKPSKILRVLEHLPPNSNPRTLNKNSAILCFNQVQKEIMNANKYILKSWYFMYQFWSCWGVRSPRAARSSPLFAAPTALLPSTKTRPRSLFLISPLVPTFFSSFSSQHHFNPSSYSPISSSSFPSIYHSLFWCTPPG